ncbi:hypothetical protein [Prescottella equi]|uniref:hypothetical protein n=1 Tax=Rhodococcus hoagii TaxID=43767 RepID=UPI000D0F257C|nr:hypothetical protein [Prescottella equi]AVP71309.1 hypothetical protein C7H75_24820 [Prescottella equi]
MTDDTIAHGTYRGAAAHIKNGEKPCDACNDARTAYMRDHRIRTGKTTSTRLGYGTLAKLLESAPATIRDRVAAELGSEHLDAILQVHAPHLLQHEEGDARDIPAHLDEQGLISGKYADNAFRFLRALRGFDPADALTQRDRALLVKLLVEHFAWTDQQVASLTKLSYHTVVRIRERLQLPANRPSDRKPA